MIEAAPEGASLSERNPGSRVVRRGYVLKVIAAAPVSIAAKRRTWPRVASIIAGFGWRRAWSKSRRYNTLSAGGKFVKPWGMVMSLYKYALSIFLFLLIVLLIPVAAVADMVVLESNVPDRYKVGARLPDSDRLDLPQCGRVKVRLPSNETKEFTAGGCAPAIPLGGMRGAPPITGNPTTPPPR